MVLANETIELWRDRTYRRRPELRLHTEEQAEAHVNEVGLCLLFPSSGIELPSLWEAICGESRSLPQTHDDHDLGLAWEWKDTLPSRGAVFYGKFLRKKPVLVSRALFPCLFALSGNFGEPDDYLERYRSGLLSEPARRVCEALTERGALETQELRRLARLDGSRNSDVFSRAMVEVQTALLVAKAGVAEAGSFRYSYVYDLVTHLHPDLTEAARKISENQAVDEIILCVLRSCLAYPVPEFTRLFGWEPWRAEKGITRLEQSGQVTAGVEVEGDERVHVALKVRETASE